MTTCLPSSLLYFHFDSQFPFLFLLSRAQTPRRELSGKAEEKRKILTFSLSLVVLLVWVCGLSECTVFGFSILGFPVFGFRSLSFFRLSPCLYLRFLQLPLVPCPSWAGRKYDGVTWGNRWAQYITFSLLTPNKKWEWEWFGEKVEEERLRFI